MATKAASAGRPSSSAFDRVCGAVDTWVKLFGEHELLTYASSIARSMVVAGVSVILLLIGLTGALGRKDLWREHLAPQIEERVLPGVYAGVNQTVERIYDRNSTGLIVFALLLAIWEISGSVRGVGCALNRVYETDETRSWKVRYPLSFGLAFVVVTALVVAILLALAAGGAVQGAAAVPFAIARWACAVLLIMLAFGLLVRFAPAKPRAKRWATLGAVLVVVGWILESLAFKYYIEYFANFKTPVGSLTVVLVIIGYLYVASIILLVGIELDELLREDDKAERTLVHVARKLAGKG
jgi:membrane protein